VVEDGNSYNDKIDVVKLEFGDDAFASAGYTNGGFTITLPESVDSRYLQSINEGGNDIEGVTITNENVKAAMPSSGAYNR
jgi:hypothetical protein